jgi:hypothetical protein
VTRAVGRITVAIAAKIDDSINMRFRYPIDAGYCFPDSRWVRASRPRPWSVAVS